jgi:hypothetical protein
MMKVRCVYNNGWKYYLTIGKIYYVIEINRDNGNYYIIDDENDILMCPKYYFKSLSEYRIERINKLLGKYYIDDYNKY